MRKPSKPGGTSTCQNMPGLVFRQLKQVEEFLAKNGVKTVKKLKAAKFEDLIFTNAAPGVSKCQIINSVAPSCK